jgi:nicotinamidase-related amidase
MCKLSDVLLVIDLQNGVCQDSYQLQKFALLVNQRIDKYNKTN